MGKLSELAEIFKPKAENFNPRRISVGTTPVFLTELAGGIARVTVQNTGTTTITVGKSDVVDGVGVVLQNATANDDGDGRSATFITRSRLYAIGDAASGQCVVIPE